MQNFTTQEHQRNQSTVLENPGKTIAQLREKQRNRNLVNGMIISAMALAVVVTGSVLGSTVAHNQQLKGQLGELTTQNQTLNQQLTEMSTVNEAPTVDKIDTDAYFNQPTTRVFDRANMAPTFTINDTTNRTAQQNCPDGNCANTATNDGNAVTRQRDADITVNPAVMAEPTTDADEVTPPKMPKERPALYANRHRATTPDADQPTPMPRVPSGHHARVW